MDSQSDSASGMDVDVDEDVEVEEDDAEQEQASVVFADAESGVQNVQNGQTVARGVDDMMARLKNTLPSPAPIAHHQQQKEQERVKEAQRGRMRTAHAKYPSFPDNGCGEDGEQRGQRGQEEQADDVRSPSPSRSPFPQRRRSARLAKKHQSLICEDAEEQRVDVEVEAEAEEPDLSCVETRHPNKRKKSKAAKSTNAQCARQLSPYIEDGDADDDDDAVLRDDPPLPATKRLTFTLYFVYAAHCHQALYFKFNPFKFKFKFNPDQNDDGGDSTETL